MPGNLPTEKEPIRIADSATREGAKGILAGTGTKTGLARFLPFFGPAFIAAIAYMDPGNFATNIQGGARFGYTLLWVILASNLAGILLQSLSAKLGIATGKNLAEHCRDAFPRPVSIGLWVLMEIVAMATDVAEFVGAAVGFNLLFGIPLPVAAVLTAITTVLILGLERYGFRPLEAVITGFVGVVAGCYLVELIIGRPDWSQVAVHLVTPAFAGPESILLAAGILGATVMPHAVFLHSALTQNRIMVSEPNQLRRLYRFELADVGIAMGVAGLVNMAMLIMAAAAFNRTGQMSVGSLEGAYRTLQPLLGPAAGTVFAVSLLASGLSSSSVGTMAGQVIMQGFIRKKIPPWVRRLVTMAPSLAVILTGLDPTRTLILTQVFLSFGLPFAVIPLVYFTSQKSRMGVLVNNRVTTVIAWIVSGLILALNFFLLATLLGGGIA